MVTPCDPSPWERSPCQVVPFSSSISRLGASSQLPAVMPAGCSGSRPWGPRLPHRWYPLRGEKQHASYCLPLPPSLLSVPVGATLRWYCRYCAVALAGCWLSSGKGVTQCPGIQPLFPWPPPGGVLGEQVWEDQSPGPVLWYAGREITALKPALKSWSSVGLYFLTKPLQRRFPGGGITFCKNQVASGSVWGSEPSKLMQNTDPILPRTWVSL